METAALALLEIQADQLEQASAANSTATLGACMIGLSGERGIHLQRAYPVWWTRELAVFWCEQDKVREAGGVRLGFPFCMLMQGVSDVNVGEHVIQNLSHECERQQRRSWDSSGMKGGT